MPMPQYEPHLYMVCFPNNSLVLSQLEPKDFAVRYSYGTTSYHAGKLIFAELDIHYRHPYFKIDEGLEKLKPHEDGSPKATKYVSAYRILEHVETRAIQTLYLSNADGTCLPLKPGKYEPREANRSTFHLYAKVAPVSMLTLSTFEFREYGRHYSGGHPYLSVPRSLYTELNFDFELFLSTFAANPFAPLPIEGVHPSKLRNAIEELRKHPDKDVKGLTLDTALTKQSFRTIKRGFMICDHDHELFFPMPSLEEIEEKDLRFYRAM